MQIIQQVHCKNLTISVLGKKIETKIGKFTASIRIFSRGLTVREGERKIIERERERERGEDRRASKTRGRERRDSKTCWTYLDHSR